MKLSSRLQSSIKMWSKLQSSMRMSSKPLSSMKRKATNTEVTKRPKRGMNVVWGRQGESQVPDVIKTDKGQQMKRL